MAPSAFLCSRHVGGACGAAGHESRSVGRWEASGALEGSVTSIAVLNRHTLQSTTAAAAHSTLGVSRAASRSVLFAR